MKYFFSLFLMLAWFGTNAQSACELYDLEVEQSECNSEKKFTLTINFKFQNTSDCFTVKGNGKNYGTFKYNQVPIKLTLSGDCTTEYEFIIRDCKTEACKLTYLLGKVCCEEECELSELVMEQTECKEDQSFCVSLYFNYQGTSKCFKISGNGKDYGKFNYSQLPVKICGLKGDCETEYEFNITDCEDAECSLSAYVGIVCCEESCKLEELKLEKTECNKDGKFDVFLNFKHKATSDCFKVYLNGSLYNTYKYNQLPVKLGSFQGDCKTAYEFTIVDCNDEKCKVSGSLGKVCCEKKNCTIKELQIKKSDCDAEKNFYVTINFKHLNTSGCFNVKGNGKLYGTFNYNQLPVKIGPLKGDCKTHYEFIVEDCENKECKASKAIGKVCCEQNKKDTFGKGDPDLLSQDAVQQDLNSKDENDFPEYALTSHQLSIQNRGNHASNTEVIICDLMGYLVKISEIIFEENWVQLNIAHLPPGLYFVKLKSEHSDKTIKIFKP